MLDDYHRQTAKFLATIAQSMPYMSSGQMQKWIEDPSALEKVLDRALHSEIFRERHMMATKAAHRFAGDVSRESDPNDPVENICFVRYEEGDNFVGEWVTGYGYVKVRFPKSTTRELTEDEKNYFRKCEIVIVGFGVPGITGSG